MTLHDDLRQQLDAPLIERLGAHLGLTRVQAVAVADEVLPAQLQRLTQLASTASGAQQLLDLARDHVPIGRMDGLTGSRDGLSALQRSGTLLLPEVMGASLDSDLQRTSAITGVAAPSVRQLMSLVLPLLLGLIASRAHGRGLSAATLTTLFGGSARAGAAAGTVTPDVVVAQGAPILPGRPVMGAPVLISERLPPPAREDDRRRRVGWWWLLPLLFVGVGGCSVLQQRPGGALRVTQPVHNARVSGPVQLSGAGQAGATVTVSEDGAPVATTQVEADGTFSVTVAEPDAGAHTYTVTQRGTPATAVARASSVNQGQRGPRKGIICTWKLRRAQRIVQCTSSRSLLVCVSQTPPLSPAHPHTPSRSSWSRVCPSLSRDAGGEKTQRGTGRPPLYAGMEGAPREMVIPLPGSTMPADWTARVDSAPAASP